MRITVVSPHRGDAAFALGLTIGAWLQRGHAVAVVNCFTRSRFAPYSDVQSLHENDKMSFATAVRRREDEAWRKLYGSAKLTLTDLNLKDAPERLHCKPEEVFGRPADVTEKVVSKIRGAIASGRSEALVLPLGTGGHVDHLSARDAAVAAMPGALPVAFYEELPFALHATEDAREAAVHQLEQVTGMALRQASANSVQGLAADEGVSRRRRMVLCYDSQLDEGATAEVAAFRGADSGLEPLWINAAWASCAQLGL